MKTKTLFLTLFAGAFLCFSNVSYGQYHSGGSGSTGDAAFDEGNNVFSLGVGFAGGVGQYFNTIEDFSAGSGDSYSSSASPGFRLDWEHGKNEHIGYGVILGYQSASVTDKYNYQTYTITGYDAFGDPIYGYSNTSYSDKYTLTFITFAARVAYHFSAGKAFDPYIGASLGYVSASISYSSTDPGAIGFSGSATGIALGIQAGARYYFSDHIGAFAELAYCTNEGENIVNVGITFKL